MTDKQPEALRLADSLERGTYLLHLERDNTATELRRQHEEIKCEERRFSDLWEQFAELDKTNQMLLEALKEICDCPQWIDEATVPKAGIEAALQQVVVNMSVALVRLRKARAAIAKAKETK